MEEKELTNVSFKELIEAIRKCGLAVSDIHLETIAEACGELPCDLYKGNHTGRVIIKTHPVKELLLIG